MPSLRLQRVRELLKRELGELLRREYPVDQFGLITVNDLEVSPDLHSASAFISILGNAEQQKRGAAAVRKDSKRLQTLVGHSVVLRYTPVLRFVIDDSIVRGNHVLQLLEDLEKSNPLPDREVLEETAPEPIEHKHRKSGHPTDN